MPRIILSLWLLLLGVVATSAQVGVHAHYLALPQSPDWQPPSANIRPALPGTGWEAGIDYWFRLKSVRIEFLPTLAVADLQLAYQSPESSALPVDYRTRQASVLWITNLYFLDFYGDCDCPTWGKDGSVLKKGLHLSVAPVLTWANQQLSSADLTTTETHWRFGLQAGLGLDIGLSELITLTPRVGLRYYGSARWDALTVEPSSIRPVAATSSVWQGVVGLRLGLRFDS